MAITRFKALELAQMRAGTPVKLPTEKVSDYYGSMTFSDEVMRSCNRVSVAIGKRRR